MAEVNFRFVSEAPGGDQFTVVNFSGHEKISELYRYEIEVKAPVIAEIDLDEVLEAPAMFISEQGGTEYPVHGVLSSFEEFKYAEHYSYFKAVLVPRIWSLSNYRTNEIYYQAGEGGSPDAGQGIDEIIREVLDKAGMASTDYDLNGLSGNLLKREYRCQFNESDFDFLSRLMENEGVFYYFEQSHTQETIVFINDLNYLSIPRPKLQFDVASRAKGEDESVYALSCRKLRLPESVTVRDYNPDEPSLDVSDTAQIDSMGHGTEYIYGKNVLSDTEASYLSRIRAEELYCRKTQYYGESNVTRLTAGHIFTLDGHPNPKYNYSDTSIEYLATEVIHKGANLDITATAGIERANPQYRNSFIAIPADIQFRPVRKTPKPKITGTLHARIDGEQDSEYAQLDDEGRYKVSLPFDFQNENHSDGLASARLRMMQPYAGEHRGMQFPLAKGTEVLLSFVDGDPDRPVIAGAISGPTTQGPVNANNQTESVIRTGGNNRIRMEDKAGFERVMFESPASNSWVRIGSKNDPVILNGSSPHYVELGSPVTDLDPGAYAHNPDDESDVTEPNLTASEIKNSSGDIIASLGDIDTNERGQYFLKYESASNDDAATRHVIIYDPNDDDDTFNLEGTRSDGVRIRSAGNVWTEAQSRFGQYYSGRPPVGPTKLASEDDAPSQIGDLLANFGNNYAPENLKKHKTGDAQSLDNAISSAHVHVSSLDTFTTQEGNIYDFGGYWNYNLGNSYAENHIDQTATLNTTHTVSVPEWDGRALYSGIYGTVTSLFPVMAAGIAVGAGSPPSVTAAGFVGGALGVAAAIINAFVTDYAIESPSRNLDDLLPSPHETDNSIQTWANKVSGHTADDTWVEKNFGNAYTFTEGDSIEITSGNSESHSIGNTYEYVYGGNHEETKFNGDGIRTAFSKSGGGLSEDYTFNPMDGALVNFAFKSTKGIIFTYELSLPNVPKISVETSFSSLSADVKVSTGMSINVEASMALALNMKYAAGFTIEMESTPSAKLEGNWEQKKFIFKGPGSQFKKDADLKAEKEAVLLKELDVDLAKKGVDLKKYAAKLEKADASVSSGMVFAGL